jgi:hypothetical protein
MRALEWLDRHLPEAGATENWPALARRPSRMLDPATAPRPLAALVNGGRAREVRRPAGA